MSVSSNQSINFSGEELPNKFPSPWANGISDVYPGQSPPSFIGKTQSQDVFAIRPVVMESVPSGTWGARMERGVPLSDETTPVWSALPSPALTAERCAEMSMQEEEGGIVSPPPQVDTDEDDDMNLRNFMVARLHPSITDKDLREMFEPFGVLERALIIIDATAGRSRGFGFITFETDAAGEKALAEMHDKDVLGMNIRVVPSKQVGVVAESDTVWVRNFPISVERDVITGLFETFGNIVSMETQVEWTTRTKRRNKVQVVRVQYESVAVAKTAIDALHGVREVPLPDEPSLELKLPLVVRFYSEERDKALLAPRPVAVTKSPKVSPPMRATQHHAARVSPPLPSGASGLTFPPATPASAVGAGMAGLVPQPFAAMQPMPTMAPMMMPMMPMAPPMPQPSFPFFPQLPYGAMMVPQPQVQPQYTVSPIGTVPQPPMVQQYPPVAMMPQAHGMVPHLVQGILLPNSSDVSPPQQC